MRREQKAADEARKKEQVENAYKEAANKKAAEQKEKKAAEEARKKEKALQEAMQTSKFAN